MNAQVFSPTGQERRHRYDRRSSDIVTHHLANLAKDLVAATNLNLTPAANDPPAPATSPSPMPTSAQAASWQRPEVRAARIVHDRVTVAGHGEFRSVPDAFRKLGLLMSKMGAFRLVVKQAGTAIFEDGNRRYIFAKA